MTNYLSPEQESLIPIYREELRQRLISTSRIDCQAASKAIKEIYSILGRETPQIIFCRSPFEALSKIVLSLLDGDIKKVAIYHLENELSIRKLKKSH